MIKYALFIFALSCLAMNHEALCDESKVLAVIDGKAINEAEFQDAISLLGDKALAARGNGEVRAALLDNLVTRKVLERAANTADIATDPLVKRRLPSPTIKGMNILRTRDRQ